jgi:outer membrane protein assembly factor BamB
MLLKHVCVWMFVVLLAAPALADEDYVPSQALREAGLIKAWQLRLRLEPDQCVADVYLVDDQLYVATNDGYVFALHAETGANRWLRHVTREGYRIRRPCHAGKRVIFATPTTVLQLDRLTGEGVSKTALRFPAGTAAASDGVRLFLGGLDQRLYAFEVKGCFPVWKAITNGALTPTPVLYEGNLFAASDNGMVYSCTADTKAYRWQRTVYGSITADLAVNEHGVYVASGDRSLYLLDLLFGEIRWQARFSGPLYESPVLTSEVVYQYCPDDGLVAVNTPVVGVDERNRWKLPRGRRLLTVDERYAYVQSKDKSILVVGIADGKLAHTLPAAGLTLGAPSLEKTALYAAGADGRVFCARPRGTPLVREGDLRDALDPAEAKKEQAAETGAAAGEAGEKHESDVLKTSRKGQPVGGKSKVSKNYGKGGGSGDGSKP